MIMHRNNIPLIAAEELGYHLGLTVPPDAAGLFYRPRISDTPPPAGYGTQIYDPQYEPNAAFKKLGIPLVFKSRLANSIRNEHDFMSALQTVQDENADALLCFNHGVIRGEYKPHSGHVVVFDRIVDGKVRIVDASWKHPKWRCIEPSLLLDAIRQHGNANSGGIWHFSVSPGSPAFA